METQHENNLNTSMSSREGEPLKDRGTFLTIQMSAEGMATLQRKAAEAGKTLDDYLSSVIEALLLTKKAEK